MPDKSLILIVGMHRSGTSCLAGALQMCGMELTEVNCRGQFNPKGNRELPRIQKLYDLILSWNHGTWHRPPREISLHTACRRMMKSEIDHLSTAGPVVGFKDPRAVLLLQEWRDVAGGDLHCAGTFRHPLAVAESLSRRDGFSLRHSLDLWLRYNSDLVRHHRREPFPLIRFDLSDAFSYCRTVARIARLLGLTPRPEKIEDFVSADLDHYSMQACHVPDRCREVYDYLCRHAAPHTMSEVPPPNIHSARIARRMQIRPVETAPPAPAALQRDEPASSTALPTVAHLYVIASQMPPNADFAY